MDFAGFLVSGNNLLRSRQLDCETSSVALQPVEGAGCPASKSSFISPSTHLELSDFLRARENTFPCVSALPPPWNPHCSPDTPEQRKRSLSILSLTLEFSAFTENPANNLGFPCNDPVPLSKSKSLQM